MGVDAATGSAVVEVAGLEKFFWTLRGEEVHALADISFQIQQGEFVSVVGPSGCGKSTLLRILGGLLAKSAGRVLIHGQEIVGPRRDIGVVFQNSVLLPWRTVYENCMLPVEVHRLDREVYGQRARDLLRMVGLEGFESKYPHELSGGMQQRNSITRALVFDPAMLLMDEPFGALDAMTREQMNLELQRIWLESRKTILFITHSISEAVFLADRVFVMSRRPGRIVDTVPIAFPRPRTLDVMGTGEFAQVTSRIRHWFSLQAGFE